MSAVRILDALRAAPLFQALEQEQMDDLAGHARQRTYRAGQLIFEFGDEGDALAVIASGRVKIAVRSADGGQLVLTWIGPGETLGELSVVDGGRRSADAEAVESSTVVLVERAAVLRAMRVNPDFAHNVARAVAASMRRLTEGTADLVFLDIPRRVAKWLTEQASAGQPVDVTISQEELAHHVGGTRQSVNAALRGFERRGWVELRSRRVLVRDGSALHRFAGG
jgi:CRP-like cAMP-binding protein